MRLWEPLAVAFADSVMVEVALLIARIVVPAGMPVPEMFSPTTSPIVLLSFVTDVDPVASVPVTSPPGAIRTAVRPESGWNAALSWTVMSSILNVPSKLGMVNVELRTPGPVAVAAGIVWRVLSEAISLRAGDRADRAHDLEHLCREVNVADLDRPVERHVERAVRAVEDQVVGARAVRAPRSTSRRARQDQGQRVLIEWRVEECWWR